MAVRGYIQASAGAVGTKTIGPAATDRAADVDEVEVTSLSGGNVYFTLDGATPTVRGDDTYVVQGGGSVRVKAASGVTPTVDVKAISEGAFEVSVEAF